MKRLICILITLFILVSSVSAFAAGTNLNLSIDEAKKLAVENSKQGIIDELNIKVKEIILQESKYSILPESGSPTDNAYKVGVQPIIVETDLELAKRTKINDENSLKLNVYKSALDILLAQKQLDLEKQKLGILQEKYIMVKARYVQKTAIESDVLDTEYSVGNKEADVVLAQDSVDSAKMKLVGLLSLSVKDTTLEIKDDLKYEALSKSDIDEIVEASLKSNAGVYEKSQNIKAKEKNLEELGHYIKENNTTYLGAEYDLEIAKLDLAETKTQLEVDIRSRYNNLLTQKDKVELAQKALKLASKKFTVVETKLKKGIVNKEGFLNEKENYLNAIYQNDLAIHDYCIVKAEFENLIL